ncbi:pseudouridine synthase [Frondihabitans sp. PAMC 28766]|uniref:tRNA pseudouridine synthase A n=1 Tax=Frondihabitans sp. PAMC 28766 TaxID=1795630 RepID=UPI00078EAB95|nr:tRNA pseudouridine synthase A [Frondihabitans sp. PAMC 28766]AMM19813.1 pseudouridine synthase [Frondihabitans sp. PAMC 28766]
MVDEVTRIRLDVSYDGTRFNGWSQQPGLRTVEGELNAALATTLQRYLPAPRLVVAGRTDTGVHAIGQVVHLDLTAEQLGFLSVPHRNRTKYPPFPPAMRLTRRLNGLAGAEDDLHVTHASIVPSTFDARYSALYREYEYRVSDLSGPRHPVRRYDTLWFDATVDLDLMNATALSLLGLHDWAAYCRPREGATTVRTLQEFVWRRDPDGILVARVRADAFCHSMVRSLVGATLAVGEGRLSVEDAVRIQEARLRNGEFKVSQAHGLTLMHVAYPDEEHFESRAKLTRATRAAL